MSSDLEQRLSDAFRELPGPGREITARARAAALFTLPRHRRRSRGRALAFAVAVFALLGIGAAALAATGRLHVELGAPRPERSRPTAAPSRLALPAGSHGFAVVAGGRLSLVTAQRVRVEGLAATTVELSPHALYVAVGRGSRLIAMAPSGRLVWARPMAGRIVAAAWAPDALQIAYVIARRGRDELRLIEGDGDHDRLVDGAVAPVKPSWRSDSLALGYVGAGGKPVVYDLAHASRRVVDLGRCSALGPVRMLAFAPRGQRLAFASRDAIWLSRDDGRSRCQATTGKYVTTGLGWLADGDLVSARRPVRGIGGYPAVVRHELARDGSFGRSVFAFLPSMPAALVLLPRSTQVVVVVARRGGFDIVTADVPRASGFTRFRTRQVLLHVGSASPVTALSWR